MRKRHLLLPLLSALVVAPCVSTAVEWRVGSTTIFRAFEYERGDRADPSEDGSSLRDTDAKRAFTAHEFLRAEAGNLSSDGFSFHAYGSARFDFSDYYNDTSDAELVYGYFQYARSTNNVLVRLGRQYVYQRLATEAFDGLRVDTDVTPYFTISAYGGQPLAVEEITGRDGDSIWGGRFSHRVQGLYDLGISYMRAANDGEEQRELLGLDVSVTPKGPIVFFGDSVLNVITDAWAEHSYQARVNLGKFTVEPSFQKFDFDAYFRAGKYTKPPFRPDVPGMRGLINNGEKLSIFGGTVSWQADNGSELGAKVKRYSYEERDDEAMYYAATGSARAPLSSRAGAEVGRMQGREDEDRYTLARAYWYAVPKTFSLTADVVYAAYDEEVYRKKYSLFASLGTGKQLSKPLSVMLRADYSSDPYFNHDVVAYLTVNYVLESK